jgi:hypothetical protein
MMKYLLVLTFAIHCLSLNISGSSQTTYVYICTGSGAYSYHNNSNCSGLNNCKSEIKKVSIEYARSLKRTPCGKCYK